MHAPPPRRQLAPRLGRRMVRGVPLGVTAALLACLLAACGGESELDADASRLKPSNTLTSSFDREAFAASYGVPPTLTYEHGLTFVLVPNGTFTAGSDVNEAGRGADEALHRVTIATPYYLQVDPLTEAQRAALGGESTTVTQDATPLARVTVTEAEALARRLQDTHPRRAVRLPREAEWEWAARAGSMGPFGAGCEAPGVAACTNLLGLRGMHTGGATWCRDIYAPYPAHPTSDPLGPRRGSSYVVRGGTLAAPARSAARHQADPTEDRGVRLVVELGYAGRIPVHMKGVVLDELGKPSGALDGVQIEMISVVDRLTDRQAGRREVWTLMLGKTPCTLAIRPGRYYARLKPTPDVREPFEQKVDVVDAAQTVVLHR